MPSRARKRVWRIRDDYRPLLIKTKKLFPTILGQVKTKRIKLVGFYKRHSNHMARISPNRNPWALFLPDHDYVIEFWSTRFDAEPEHEKVYVMLHELLHIPPGGCIEGEPSHRKTVKHDIEDFTMLRSVYGLHLTKVSDVLKGEQHLLEKTAGKDSVRRFPRYVRAK